MRSWLGWWCALALVVGVYLLQAGSFVATASEYNLLRDPVALRPQQPIKRLYGLPVALSARLPGRGRLHARAILNLTNEYRFVASDAPPDALPLFDERYLFDGEIYETTFLLRYGLHDRLSIGLEAQAVMIQSGQLDEFVDTFHTLFGFDHGGRDKIKSRRLLYTYYEDYIAESFSTPRYATPTTGDAHTSAAMSDLRLRLHYAIFQDAGSGQYLSFGVQYKHGIGKPEFMHNSGKDDWSVSLNYSDEAFLQKFLQHDSLTLHAAVGFVQLGKPGLVPHRQREDISYAWLGFNHPLWNENWRAKYQLHASNAPWDSRLEIFQGLAFDLIGGVSYAFSPDSVFDLALAEDQPVGSSSDFVLHFSYATLFG